MHVKLVGTTIVPAKATSSQADAEPLAEPSPGLSVTDGEPPNDSAGVMVPLTPRPEIGEPAPTTLAGGRGSATPAPLGATVIRTGADGVDALPAIVPAANPASTMRTS